MSKAEKQNDYVCRPLGRDVVVIENKPVFTIKLNEAHNTHHTASRQGVDRLLRDDLAQSINKFYKRISNFLDALNEFQLHNDHHHTGDQYDHHRCIPIK